MDPAVKTAMAFCVLLAGVCAALLFRRDSSRQTPPAPTASEQLLIRHVPRGRMPAPATDRGRTAKSSRVTSVQTPNGGRPAIVVTPLDRHESPPQLAESYPETGRAGSARWGVSMDMLLPVASPRDDSDRVHKVVDGDTLAALAERYLGSAARAGEIFEANRDVLHDPELLPIGAELKMPPRTGPDQLPVRPLSMPSRHYFPKSQ
jgi:nucleoid-associated protein YgaU